MQRSPKLPPEWAVYSGRKRKRSSGLPAWAYAVTGLLMGGVLGLGIFFWPAGGEILQPNQLLAPPGVQRSFSLCHTGGGTNCVVDGDTIWLDGVKIRLADIDAPETHPPRCDREADLGNRATQRLLSLVNAGPFEAVPTGSRDEDRHGRKLRLLERDGKSLGDVLVSEGLARRWDGSRHPWC